MVRPKPIEMSFNKGDILRGRRGKVIHPLAYWGNTPTGDYVGIMLTHATSIEYNNNIALDATHIKENDENGVKFNFQYSNTHFLNAKLIKKQDWGKYTKIGELTNSGIAFIAKRLPIHDPLLWNLIPSFKKQKRRS